MGNLLGMRRCICVQNSMTQGQTGHEICLLKTAFQTVRSIPTMASWHDPLSFCKVFLEIVTFSEKPRPLHLFIYLFIFPKIVEMIVDTDLYIVCVEFGGDW